ncbi:MAG TPA: tetratricopeptide repeat protein [Pyrinomonadaceae bacterium]|nr:tetratricopeptide repeat protein [Pyrinomonadaceae bacterium]
MNIETSVTKRFVVFLTTLVLGFLLISFPGLSNAQTDDIPALKVKAGELLNQNKFTEALPLLEKIAVAEPKNADIQFYFGYCLLAKSIGTKDEPTRRQLRIQARNLFIKAKELGNQNALVETLINTILPDGSEKPRFSDNKEVEALMQEGEIAFTEGRNEDAIKFYQKALELDPKLYFAALFIGDVYRQKKDFANAEIWFEKAIVIDPNIETAYRYSATPLMEQGKFEAARDRYIEAFITEPYSRLASGGLTDWAQAMNKMVGHPRINIPTDVSKNKDGNLTITLGASDKKDDGSSAWTVYGIHRAAWQLDKDGKPSDYFAKAYPNEKVYRHSLAEEFEALKMVVETVKKDKTVVVLEPSLYRLIDLYDKGLLEPYILLARTDKDIIKDYPAYLKANRPKLRKYVIDYVLH